MSSELNRKVGTADRALEFMRANPFASEAEQAVVAELQNLHERGVELQGQVLEGEGLVAEGSRQRRALADAVVRELLRPLARAAAAVGDEEPAVARLTRIPSARVSMQKFRVAMEAAATLSGTHKDVLVRHGLSPSLPDELAAGLGRFETAMEQAHAGRRAHIGARAELQDVGHRITAVLRQLDGMNMYRYRKDPERSAAWKSAKRVTWPSPVPAGEQAKETAGKVKPAA